MSAQNEPSASRPIVSSLVLAESREVVFAAFSDPARLAQWWGPNGFTNDFHQFDFRPGGIWRFTMRGSDGTPYAMDHQFMEIVRPARIVVRHFQPGHDFTLTITLAVQGTGSAVTWAMCFDDPAEADRLRAFLETATAENLARLAAHLTLTTQKP
ncbi:MAG TPA: SRPBCC domain-containing protein [Lacunisphaera sp.]